MSEAPQGGGGGLCSSRLDEFSMTGTADALNRLGWWELMQHHGAPTRLLDWTRSPFIGLWFAFWCHQDGDGDVALWIFDTANSWINHPNAFRAEPATWAEFLDDRHWQNRAASGDKRVGSVERTSRGRAPRPRVLERARKLRALDRFMARLLHYASKHDAKEIQGVERLLVLRLGAET